MDLSNKDIRRNEEGFTLVELAVVMIIIGLLIGGILKGQELITNARVTSTAGTMEAFGAAFNGFRDQYNALPGDMGNASTRIAACATIDACDDGGADGTLVVGVGEAPGNDEGTFFFGQLLAADFITGMDGSDDGTNVAFGVTNPTAPVGGGFFVGDERSGVEADFSEAVTLRGINIVLTGIVADVAADTGVLTNAQAANIDRRLDDGAPISGTIVGDDDCNDDGPPAVYNEDDAVQNCSISYRIN